MSRSSAYGVLDSAKYFCTLTLFEYDRPKPFDPVSYRRKKVIRLPLPQELNDSTVVAYNNVDLKAVGDFANKDIVGFGAQALRQAGQAVAAGGGAMGEGLNRMAQTSTSGTMGLASLAGAATIENAFDAEAIGSALQQAMGVAPNPNPSVAFQGPVLREMNYTWNLMATNEQDSRAIRSIIKELKKRSLPRANAGLESAAILDYPSVCQMNFFPWDSRGSGPYGWADNSIIKMKRCFMSSVNVNYTGGAAPAFFAGWNNEPVTIQLSINMKEIEYFLSKDYGDTEENRGLLGGLAEVFKGIFNLDYKPETPPEAPSGDPAGATDPTAGAADT
jgi:hypothetical protein